MFTVVSGDNWNEKYYLYYRTVSPVLSSIFFLSLIIVGQYILLMLFLAILVENFDEQSKNKSNSIKIQKKNNWKERFFDCLYKKTLGKLRDKFLKCDKEN